MEKVKKILFGFLILIVAYTLFLKLFPLKKNIFYTNDERTEEFIYWKKQYPIVIAGSSLSGIFTIVHLFRQHYFNMYMPYAGSCTGVEIIKRTQNIPKTLFVETNRIDRGIDTTLIENVFSEPFYSLKYYLPFLLKKNRFLPNLVDRVKAPQINSISLHRPPLVLYNQLLADAQKEWGDLSDAVKAKIDRNFLILKESLTSFSKKGCEIYLFEVPMDSSLYKSPLLTYERNCFIKLSKDEGYKFIKADTTRSYKTGDGEHLLKSDGVVYIKYFLSGLDKKF